MCFLKISKIMVTFRLGDWIHGNHCIILSTSENIRNSHDKKVFKILKNRNQFLMVPSHYTFGLNEHFSHSITFHKHLLENTECFMKKYNTEWNIIKLLPWIFSILSPFVSSSLMGGLILEVLLCPWTISASNSSWEVRVLGATGRVCFCEPFIYKKKTKNKCKCSNTSKLKWICHSKHKCLLDFRTYESETVHRYHLIFS